MDVYALYYRSYIFISQYIKKSNLLINMSGKSMTSSHGFAANKPYFWVMMVGLLFS
jgi:hypothetical protein